MDGRGFLHPPINRDRWLGVSQGVKRNEHNISMVEEFAQRQPLSIVIFGHSFIKHLQRDTIRRLGQYHNFGFDYSVANVVFVHQNGLKVDQARYELLYQVAEHRPDIVYIELGTCDLSNKHNTARSIGEKMVELGNHLTGLGVSKVLFGEIIFRRGNGIPASSPEFNFKVDDLNRFLQVAFDETYSKKINLWRHKGMMRATKNIYFNDGIHLNQLGNLRLYRSIRAALIKAIWYIIGKGN